MITIAAVLLVLAFATGSNAGNEIIQTHTLEPSPKCWRSATAIFDHGVQQHGSSALDAKDICALLPEEQQKALALEIARCHLGDLGKALMKDQTGEEKCSPINYSSVDLHWCLRNLSDAGANAYTHYVSYVQQFCIRLTQELLMHQQQQTQHELSVQYADISGRSIEQMKAIADFTREHTTQLQSLSEFTRQVKESLTEELQVELRNSLQQSLKHELKQQLAIQLEEQLEGQVGSLLREQAVEQAAFVGNIMEHIQARDEDHRERYEIWTNFQSTMWQQQIEENREKMQSLSETISKTSRTMQPLLVLEYVMKAVSEGYTWLTLMLHFAIMFTLVWLFTRPTRCHGFRVYLYLLVLAEGATELVLLGLHQNGLMGEEERCLFTNELRRWALAVQCTVYVICFCFSFIAPKKQTSAQQSFVDVQSHNRAMEELREAQLQVLQRMEALKGMSMQQQSMNRHHHVMSGAQQSDDMIQIQEPLTAFRSPPPLVPIQSRPQLPARALQPEYVLPPGSQTIHPVYHIPRYPANHTATVISNPHLQNHPGSAAQYEYAQERRVFSSSRADPRLEEHGNMVPAYVATVSPANNTPHQSNIAPMPTPHQEALPTSLPSPSLDHPNHGALSSTHNVSAMTASLPEGQGGDGAPSNMDCSAETAPAVDQPEQGSEGQQSSRKQAATEVIDSERPLKKARCSDTENVQ